MSKFIEYLEQVTNKKILLISNDNHFIKILSESLEFDSLKVTSEIKENHFEKCKNYKLVILNSSLVYMNDFISKILDLKLNSKIKFLILSQKNNFPELYKRFDKLKNTKNIRLVASGSEFNLDNFEKRINLMLKENNQ